MTTLRSRRRRQWFGGDAAFVFTPSQCVQSVKTIVSVPFAALATLVSVERVHLELEDISLTSKKTTTVVGQPASSGRCERASR